MLRGRHGAARRLPSERPQDVLREEPLEVAHSLLGVPGGVRRQDDSGVSDQGMVPRSRLDGEDVEARAGEVAPLQGVREGPPRPRGRRARR